LALEIITQDQASKDNVDINADNGNVSDNENTFNLSITKSVIDEQNIFTLDIFDPKIGILLMTKLGINYIFVGYNRRIYLQK
jgi:hypothetical protein